MLNIHGYGDDLTINNIRIGDLSPKQHEEIEISKGGKMPKVGEKHFKYTKKGREKAKKHAKKTKI